MPALIKRKGSPYWYARFMVKGKDVWVSTKKQKRDEARIVAEAAEQRERGGESLTDYFNGLLELLRKLPPKDQDAKRKDYAGRLLLHQSSTLKVSGAWQAWVDSPLKGNPSERTTQNYDAAWRRFNEWILSKRVECLHEVTPLLVQDYASDLWRSNVSPATFNAHVKFLRAMFRTLEDKAGLSVNPWDKIKTLEKETQGRANFTLKELNTICSKADGSLRYMIAIALYTGMRLGDVVSLRWDNINFHDGKIVIIPRKTRRKGKTVELPILGGLDRLLKELKVHSVSDYLFPEEHALYEKDTGSVTKRIQQFFIDCGIKTQEKPGGHRRRMIVRKGFHSLRHSFVSLAAMQGIPQAVIQELVGHGSPAMTAHYSHVAFKEKRQALKAMPPMRFGKPRKVSRLAKRVGVPS